MASTATSPASQAGKGGVPSGNRKAPNSSSKPKKTGRVSPPVSGSKLGKPTPPVSGSKAKRRPSKDTPQDPAPIAFTYEDFADRDGRPETPAEKRIRALRKKVREIDAIVERVESEGITLDAAQAEKVASKPELEQQIETLKLQAAEEAREAAIKAAAEAKAAAEKAAEEEAARARSEAGKAAAAAALARQRREALEILANVAPSSEVAQTDPRLRELLRQVSDLSQEVFDEDCTASGVSKKKGWRLSLLARPVPEDPDNAPPEEPTQLLGFIVFRFRPDHQCLSIAKLAVPKEFRGRGFGRRLMEWCTKYAKQQGTLQHVTLSSLPEAVKFYQSFGFKAVKVDMAKDDEDLVEGQVYMEYKLKGVPRRP